ncbi:hypothetical protein FEDK69T_03660 [Flavobacterium enshiense DK69]|uniref:Uncharacterized protein n=1 Tax=Flavobacterium enshiense DK69 TaxID=1107311 RepID=V6SDQ8_9FLAO|nr:hypothetical protein [Flavobacterium enshiense]ESU24813.1 hypothetical protein FEDK69T_03660 [Flavobacterium enshiense DK69]KGO96733.1 hypothetical protein Q767_03220 [Flavobacterium enshiense DK69]
MKKVILSAFMVMGLTFSAEAQDLKNAIGLRLGNNDGFGAEVSYQRWVSKKNRLEFDFGWRDSDDYDAVKLTGIYQWVWNIENGFKWYAGPGLGIGSYSVNHDHHHDHDHDHDDSGMFLIATGDIGIEYNFDFPLQLSFDFRPEIYVSDEYGDVRDDHFGGDFGLSVRYRF